MAEPTIHKISFFNRQNAGGGWEQACRAYGVDPERDSFGVAYVKVDGERWSFITYDDNLDVDKLNISHTKPGWFTDSPTW